MDAKTLCLGVLTLGPASGYEIRKWFEDGPFACFHDISFGAIYPALGKLSEDGLVTWNSHPQEGRPDKKVYEITPAGLAAFRRPLARQPAPDSIRSDTIYMMFFGQLMERVHLAEVFDAYLESHRDQVARMLEDKLDGAPRSQRFVHGFGLAIYRAMIAYMEENRGTLLAADGEAREADR